MVSFGITSNISLPVRIGPDQRSEMLSQLLFGEIFKITLSIGGWCKIQTETDNYSGWVMSSAIQIISEEDYNSYLSSELYILRSLTKAFTGNSGSEGVFLLPGSSIFGLNKENGEFSLGLKRYTLENIYEKEYKNTREAILYTASYFLEAPYLWGGRSLFGIDCSGLTQVSFKINGIKIRRDASQQAEEGSQVHFLNESKPGDLAFFDNEKGLISHVGILLGNDRIIHASGKVRIDKIDYQGIVNTESKKYTHKLRLIKAIL